MGGSCEHSQGALDVLAERRRQVQAEGFDARHDAKYRNAELLAAALTYGARAAVTIKLRARGTSDEEIEQASARHGVPASWPWGRNWWKPHPLRKCLVIAAALIIAQIDAIDRGAACDDK
ncbi:hypothetical protein [Bosea sp. (in: a-proteobacteria)]|uniref:hypothetical protein n=1 Tax=Bosea sp. (in: a-proteobacteria) TaxID=1871050 RepID=UPI002636F4EA|nr:hypothetical protein [Bosea sp. (in: a-proteobacteria)]MCO5091981.1 hypothetical protein [Bosea sp. (in: a-proteobacteria)]